MPTIPYLSDQKDKYKKAQSSISQSQVPSTQMSSTQRKAKYYNQSGWKKLRQKKLMEQPTCELCACNNQITPADCVHHKIKFDDQWTESMSQMLFLDPDNTMSLCTRCHENVHYRPMLVSPVQKKYLNDWKDWICSKYLQNNMVIKWTEDANVTQRC